MTALLSIAIDVAIVAAVALLAVALMRGQSAAVRHLVLSVAFVAAALMPLLEATLPTLPVLEWPSAAPVMSSSLAMSSEVFTVETNPETTVEQTTAVPWVALLAGVWALGVVVVTGRLLRGFIYLARLESRSHVIDNGRWRDRADAVAQSLSLRRGVTILRSPEPAWLITYGVRRPKLVLPPDADDWSDERVQMVLTHELAHVRRHDSTTMLLAALVCALHWFNPLVWLCATRLRRESECACDDAVLREGLDATSYAALLLSVARGAAASRPWVAAPAIAHPSTLERRIAAMLQGQRNRAPLTRLAKGLAAIIAAAIVMPLAAAGIAPAAGTAPAVTAGSDVRLPAVHAAGDDVTPVAAGSAPAAASANAGQPQTVAATPGRQGFRVRLRVGSAEGANDIRETPAPAAVRAPAAAPAPAPIAQAPIAAAQEPGTITGSALDQSGAVLPGVTIQLIDPEAGVEVRRTTSDTNGRFAFRDVQPGRYQTMLSLAGFGTVSNVVQLEAGTINARVITLPLGTLEETITVGCTQASASDVAGRRAGFWARALEAFMPTLSAQDARPRPVRVGGNVKPPLKVNDVRPLCPATLVPASGAMLRLIGRIGVDGLLYDVRRVETVSAGEVPGELIDSALEAVRQWVFTPTLLNGQPVDVNVNIRITYR